MSKPDVKAIIVRAANQYFSKFGFYKTTMDEIAKHIHKAKGVLYYHFNSKEELFNEVLKQELEGVKTELRKVINDSDDALNMLNNYIFTRFDLLHNSDTYHETLKADFFEKYHFVEKVRGDFAKFDKEQLYFIISKGIKEGTLEISDLESTVDLILMVMNSMEIPLFLQNKYSEYIDTGKELASFIIRGLKS
ncbi:MAG: helix-turn-helix domain-containing protein [Draconibacterium sp.]